MISAIGDCAGNAEDAARFYKADESAAKTLRNVGYELEDCAGELRSAFEDFSYVPSELEEIEARLDELFRLSVKYGSTEDEMLSFLDSAREERNKIALSDERVKELDALVSSTKTEVRALAEKLTAAREKAAREYERGVTNSSNSSICRRSASKSTEKKHRLQ